MQQDKAPSRNPRATSADATRARILTSAQRAFSSRGYGDVGLREIAAGAGCDTTLIRRYFGPKERLFEQALASALDVTPLLDGGRSDFGARTLAFFAQGRPEEVQPLRMLIFATSDPVSRAITLRLLDTNVIGPIATWLCAANARILAARISMLCSGYFLYSQVLPLGTGDSSDPWGTDAWLAQELQRVVDSAG